MTIRERWPSPRPPTPASPSGRPVSVNLVGLSELSPGDVADWRAVQARDPRLASPFLSAAFAQAVADIWPDTRVAVIEQGGQRGYLPLHLRRRRTGAALGLGFSDVQGLVAPPEMQVDLGDVLKGCGLGLFEFDHLEAGQVRHLAGSPSRLSTASSPAIDLTSGFEAWFASIESGSFRRNLARRRRNLVHDHGPLTAEWVRDHGALEQVMSWKSAQYQRTGRRDRLADRRTRELLHRILDCTEAEMSGALTVLKAGDTFIAGHLGLASGRTLASWMPAYDRSFARYGPGLLLLIELARSCVERGLPVVDLGKGDEDYKQQLSNSCTDLLVGTVATSTWRQAAHTLAHWPADTITRWVLAHPRARVAARRALAVGGRLGVRYG